MISACCIRICLYVVNRIFLFCTIPKELEIYTKLTIPSLAGFYEVLNIFLDVKYHILLNGN